MCVGRGLLEGLEQRVLALLRHRLRTLDDEDPTPTLEGPIRDRRDHLAADVLDEVLIAGGTQPGEVGMRRGVGQDTAACILRIVGPDRQQLAGEGASHLGLAAARTGR